MMNKKQLSNELLDELKRFCVADGITLGELLKSKELSRLVDLISKFLPANPPPRVTMQISRNSRGCNWEARVSGFEDEMEAAEVLSSMEAYLEEKTSKYSPPLKIKGK